MKKQSVFLLTAATATVAIAAGFVVWTNSQSSPVTQARVAFHLDSDFGSALIRVAEAEGTFAKYGIDAELTDYVDGPAAIDAMVESPESEIALATSSAGSFVSYVPTNKSIKIISQLANNEDNYYWVVKEGKGNGKVLGLRGLKLGYPQISGYRTFLQLSLEDHGLNNDDVKLIPLPASEFADAMASGKIDAHPSRILLTEKTLAAVDGKAYELHDVGAYDWFNVLSTRVKTIEEQPEILSAILRALLETQSSSYLDPEAARAEVAKSLKISVDEVPKRVIDSSNIRLSNGMLRQMTTNRRLLAVDLGISESEFFESAKELIDSSALESVNPVVVHID